MLEVNNLNRCKECKTKIEIKIMNPTYLCYSCQEIENILLQLENKCDNASVETQAKCIHCFQPITAERIDSLGHVKVCVNCSQTPKHFGLMDFSHKTAGTVVIVNGNEKESIRRMKNAYTRKR
jgi:hypothetical protein